MSDDTFLDGLGMDAIAEGFLQEVRKQTGSDKQRIDALEGMLRGCFMFTFAIYYTLPPSEKAKIVRRLKRVSGGGSEAVVKGDAVTVAAHNAVKDLAKLLDKQLE